MVKCGFCLFRMVILKYCVMSACAIAVIGVVAAAASSVGRIKSFHGGSDQGYSYFAGFQPFMGLPTGWQSEEKVWPELKFNWKTVTGGIIGFLGAALGSVGGVGGGGIFVPTLSLIIGFDAKSSAALSMCMIMGAAASTVWYNLKMKHPTKNLPIIDYELALLFQPMLMMGISIGVMLNVIFANWMVTLLIMILFIATSIRSFLKGVQAWNQETILKAEKWRQRSLSVEGEENRSGDYQPLHSSNRKEVYIAVGFFPAYVLGQCSAVPFSLFSLVISSVLDPLMKSWGDQVATCGSFDSKTSALERISFIMESVWFNIRWKEVSVILSVWVIFLALQILQHYSSSCGLWFWIFNALQVPVAFGVTTYEGKSLRRRIKQIWQTSNVEDICSATVEWTMPELILSACSAIIAGMAGGLLGLGGGFFMGPVLLELGVAPQVSSATATFVMLFSSSLSVVEYYFLHSFPVPYALYLVSVCFLAGFWGRYIVRRLVLLLGRTSLIIFILSGVIFASAVTMGAMEITRAVEMLERKEYMGFLSLCKVQ